MAHFARIDDSIVQEVVVVADEHLLDGNGQPDEALGVAYLHSIGLEGDWVQTSPTGAFRGHYAGVGDLWDGTNFVEVEPLPNPASGLQEQIDALMLDSLDTQFAMQDRLDAQDELMNALILEMLG